MFIHIASSYNVIHSQKADDLISPICNKTKSIEFTIYQLHVNSGFSYKVTNKISGSAYCHVTGQDIPNVKWTPEMESRFEAIKKEVVIEPPSTKYSLLFKCLLLILGIIFSVLGYFIWQAQYSNHIQKNPQIGDMVYFYMLYQQEGEGVNSNNGFTWGIISSINDTSIVLETHQQKNEVSNERSFSLDKTLFTGETLQVDLEAYRQKGELKVNNEEHPNLLKSSIYKYKR